MIFILIATFVVVNLFIAVIVDSFASLKDDTTEEDRSDVMLVKRTEFQALQQELMEMKDMIAQLHRPTF